MECLRVGQCCWGGKGHQDGVSGLCATREVSPHPHLHQKWLLGACPRVLPARSPAVPLAGLVLLAVTGLKPLLIHRSGTVWTSAL